VSVRDEVTATKHDTPGSAERRVAPPITQVCDLLSEHGILSLVLRDWDGVDRGAKGSRSHGSNQVLVHRTDARAARAALDALDWRYAWRHAGLIRQSGRWTCWWDDGPELDLLWGLPALPLPARWLDPVAAALWRGASRGADGLLRPEPGALLVHLSVQACRPGWQPRLDWMQLRALLKRFDDIDRAERIARAAGVSHALRTTLVAAQAGAQLPGPSDLYDGARNVVWRIALAAQARARPRRLRRILSGSPVLGDVPVRVRIAGLDLVADRGVFVPPATTEHLVTAGRAALAPVPRPVAVEVGTGCGAIALALAQSQPAAEIHAIEISGRAVASARRNGTRLGIRGVTFHRGSLLAPLPARLAGSVDLVVANLPYIPPFDDTSVGSLPNTTIRGLGVDGLGLQRALARQAIPFLHRGSLLVLQMLASQWPIVSPELAALGYRAEEPERFGAFLIAPYRWVGAVSEAMPGKAG
jgi:methylase of polypeptide subunit release factors